MSIPKTPIKKPDDYYRVIGFMINDLTEFYEMKRRQEECNHGTEFVGRGDKTNTIPYGFDFCPDCGADLTKGLKL